MQAPAVGLAFVTSLPGYGGGEKWFLEAARSMAERGRRVMVVGQPGAEVVRRAAAAGLHTAAVSMHGVLDVRTLRYLGRLLRQENIGLAVTNQAREIRLLALSQLGRRDFRQIARRGSPDPIKNVWHYRWLYGCRVHRMIVNCHALVPKITAEASWFDETKIRVIHNGIDVDAYSASASRTRAASTLDLSDKTLVVSLIGEVGARKDQATFLHAVAALRRGGMGTGGRPVVCLIVGEGDERAALENLSADLGLDDGMVRWLGFRHDVPDILARSDLLVLPTRKEGFPNTLLEGMALGVPVVATPVDGIPELVVDGVTGVLTPPGDSEALSLAMRGLLADEDRRRAMGDAGRERVRTSFSQTTAMDALEKLIMESIRE